MTISQFLRLMLSVGALSMLDRLAGMGLGMILARWLGVSGYGVYAFAMAFLSLVQIPAKWGQPSLLLRELATSGIGPGGFNPAHVQKVAVKVALAVCLGFSVLAVPVIAYSYRDESALRSALYLALLLLPATVILEIACYGLKGFRYLLSSAWFATLTPNLILLAAMALVFFCHLLAPDPNAVLSVRLLATLGTTAVAWWMLIVATRRQRSDASAGPRMIQMFQQGFPFMLLAGSSVLMSRADIFLLGLFAKPAEVGIYNVAFQASLFVSFGLQTANLITTQEYATLQAENKMERLESFAIKTSRINMLIGLAALVPMIFFAGPLIRILFGNDFSGAYSLLIIQAVGRGISLIFGEPGFILNMGGYEKTTVRIFGATALLNVVLCFIAIPLAGATGAALASSFSLIMWRALAWAAVKSKVGISCAIF